MEDPDYNELDDMLAELETAFQNIEDAPISQPQDVQVYEQYDQQQPENGEYQSEYYQEETYVAEEQQYQDASPTNAGSYQTEEPVEVVEDTQQYSTHQDDIEPPPTPQPEPEPEPVVEVVKPRRPPPVPMKRANSQPTIEQEEVPPSKPTQSESAPEVAPRPNKPLPVPVKKETPKPPPKPGTLDNSTTAPPPRPARETTPQPTPPSTPPTRPPAKPAPTPITRQPSSEFNQPPKSQPPTPIKRVAPSPPTRKAETSEAPPQQTSPQPQVAPSQAPPYQESDTTQSQQQSDTQNAELEQRQKDLEERRKILEERKKMASLRRSTSIDSPPDSPTLSHNQAQPSPGTSPSQTSFGAVKPSNRTIRGLAELGRARSLVIDPESLKNSFLEQREEKKEAPAALQTPPSSLQTPSTQQTPPPYQAPPPTLQTPPPTLQTPPPSLQTPPTQQTPPPYQATPPPYQATPPPYQAATPSNSATMRHAPHVPQAIPPRRTQLSMDSLPLAALAALQQPPPSANAAPVSAPAPSTLIALYNYKARGTTFSSGDIDVDMLLNDTMTLVLDLKNGWLRVNLKGKVGLVPASYVRPYVPNPVTIPPRPAPVAQPAATQPAPAQTTATQSPANQNPANQNPATQSPATGATTPTLTSPVVPQRPTPPVKASPVPGRAPPVTPRPSSVRTVVEEDSPGTQPLTTSASAPTTPNETPTASPAPSPVPRRPAPPVPGVSPGPSPVQSPAQSPAPTPARPVPGRIQPSQSYPSPQSTPPSNSPGKPSSVSDIRNKIGANINLGAFKGSGPPALKKLPSMGAIPLPKVQVEELTRGRIRFARLIVSYIDANNVSQQVEKKFPVVSDVSHVTGWCVKQFFGGTSAPGSQPKEKEAFGLFYNNKVLDPEKPLCCFHNFFSIREPIQVELRKVKLEEVLCRVSTKEQDVSVTLKVTQFTSVWFVLMQTMKKMQAKSGETPENYRLYFESTNEDLDETELMFAYKDKLTERIICGMRGPLPGENHKINCLYNDLYSFDINPNSNTETLLRKLLKQEVVRRSHEAFHPLDLYLEFSNSSSGENEDENESSGEEEEILDEYTPFASYSRLFEQNLVEAKRRGRIHTIELDGIPYILNIDRNTTVEDVLNLIAFNAPDALQGNPLTEFTLIVGEVALLWDRTVQSYDIKDEPLAFRRKPKPIIVFLGEKSQKTVEVDFTAHVAKLLPAIFRAFGMAVPKKDSDFTLRRLSPDAPVEMTRSLAGQNIPMNATLILKIVEKQPIVRTFSKGESDPSLGPNIYEEEANPTTIIWDSDEPNVVRAGTLNKLVEFITNPQTDIEFMKGFLMTYQSFTTPPRLLRKLIERFNVPIPSSSDENDNFEKGVKRPIQLRVCSTLKHWMENHWQDFDHELTQQLVDFTDNLPHEEATIANQLRQAILKRTCGMKTRNRAAVVFTKNFPESILKLPKKSAGEAIHILDYDELEIARQLSLIECEYYQKVLPTEFLGQCWSKQETQHLAPNLLSMIARSTALSLWISNMIVDPARVKTRAQRFTKLIKIAENLRKLNNFSTLMAFLGAFNNASVSRLKFTKALIPKKQQDSLVELEAVMSVESSSKSYRQALRSSNPPCIPYIGTYLSDLTFIDDGNKNNVSEHNLINFGKRMLTHRVISEIQRYQQVSYCFTSVAQIMSHIKDLGVGDEKTFSSQLYEKSLAREPRGAEKVV